MIRPRRGLKILILPLVALWIFAFVTTFFVSTFKVGLVFLISATILGLALVGMRKDLRKEVRYELLIVIITIFFLWLTYMFRVLEGFENPRFWPVFLLMSLGLPIFWIIKDVRKYGWKGIFTRDIERFQALIGR